MANILGQVSKDLGLVQEELKIGRQAGNAADLFGKAIHITAVGYSKRKDEETGEISDYAIFVCSEFPKNFFGMGQNFDQNVEAWQAQLGDEGTSCKKVNEYLAENPLYVVFDQTTSRKSGRRFNIMTILPEDSET